MEPTHGAPLYAKHSYRIVRDALRYLPSPGQESIVPNHIGRTHSSRIVNRYSSLRLVSVILKPGSTSSIQTGQVSPLSWAQIRAGGKATFTLSFLER